MRSKSSRPRSTPASLAMAIKCKTALVEPPMASTTVMAFSKAWRVIMSRGRTSSSSRRSRVTPALRASSTLRGSMAGMEASPGRDMPIISMAVDMVLAVNRPAQEPSPGQATHSRAVSSSRVMLPLA